MNSVPNSIPALGHAKALIHYACGDKEGGEQALDAANRNTLVMASGVGGFVLGGPVGAVVGGITIG